MESNFTPILSLFLPTVVVLVPDRSNKTGRWRGLILF